MIRELLVVRITPTSWHILGETMNEKLETKLKLYAHDRQVVNDQATIILELKKDLRETDLYKKIQVEEELLTKLNGISAVADGEVRELALDVYELERNKTVCDGVKVGEYKVVKIDDYEAALAWAVEHNMALRIDLAPFKKIVKAGAKPDGVTLETELKVSIAKDLSKYL